MMGLALGMELNQLNSFSKRADPIKCYTEVFSAWITPGVHKGNALLITLTWVTFINLLKLPIVGETELAVKIEE